MTKKGSTDGSTTVADSSQATRPRARKSSTQVPSADATGAARIRSQRKQPVGQEDKPIDNLGDSGAARPGAKAVVSAARAGARTATRSAVKETKRRLKPVVTVIRQEPKQYNLHDYQPNPLIAAARLRTKRQDNTNILEEAREEFADPWTREDTLYLSAVIFVLVLVLLIGMALGAAL